jgi:hypothetical protein
MVDCSEEFGPYNDSKYCAKHEITRGVSDVPLERILYACMAVSLCKTFGDYSHGLHNMYIRYIKNKKPCLPFHHLPLYEERDTAKIIKVKNCFYVLNSLRICCKVKLS